MNIDDTHQQSWTPKISCPCCGYITLSERGGFEMCPICSWEDDGQDDDTAHLVRGGPNGELTLWQSRTNFLIHGSYASYGSGRPPKPWEIREREWELFEGMAVEKLPGSTPDPWNLLHDGHIIEVKFENSVARLLIECDYTRKRFPVSGEYYQLLLLNPESFYFLPNEGEILDSSKNLEELEPDILTAELEDDGMHIYSEGGKIITKYEWAVLKLNDTTPLALEALDKTCFEYWEEWSKRKKSE